MKPSISTQALALSIIGFLALGINSPAATFPTAYDTNTDAVAQLFVRSQIGVQVGPGGSNYQTAAQVIAQIGAQVGPSGSNYQTAAQVITQIGAQVGPSGSNFIGTNVPYAHIANLNQGTNGSQYQLRDDSARIAGLPVAVFTPIAPTSTMIVDLMPSGDNTITNTQSPFLTSIDLLNRNLSSVLDNTNFYVLRLGLKTNVAIIGGSAGGTNDAPQVIFQAGTNNTRPFSWVLQSTGNTGNNTNMFMDSAGSLHESNGIAGTTVADNPLAGVVGEFTNRLNVFGTATNFLTLVPTNVLVMTLSAGDWDVSGNVNFSGTTATVTAEVAGITTAGNSVPGDGSQCFSFPLPVATSYTDTIAIPPQRINVSTSTTVFMTAKVTFSAGTVVGWGQIRARRVR